MDNRAFYFIGSDTTCGKWVDLDDVSSIEDIREELVNAGLIDSERVEGCELFVADTEGELAGLFLGGYSIFDLEGFIEARDSDMDEDIVVAFISLFNEWNADRCQECYYGKHDSKKDFAWQLMEDCGDLSEIPERLQCYFDIESYARDLFISDFVEQDGHVFHNY